jgi:hypothetical protein
MHNRLVAATAAAALMLASGVAGAPGASAASLTLTADCSDPYTLVTLPFEVLPGDTITVNYANCPSALTIPGVSEITGSNWTLQQDYGFAQTYLLDTSSGMATFDIVGTQSAGEYVVAFSKTMTYNDWINFLQGIGPAPEPSATVAAIPAWVQAYGRASSDATCLGGWSPSWQGWAVPVTGGWVCTRSIPSLG